MSNHLTKFLVGSMVGVMMTSCVNPEYDLEHIQIDEIHAFEQLALPIGSTKKIFLQDVMGNLEFGKYLKTYDNGDYYLDVISGQISKSVEIPSIAFDGYHPDNPNQTTIKTPITIPELVPGLKFGPIEFAKISYDVEIDQNDLPELISGISYADVSTNMVVKFSYDLKDFPFKKIYLQKGLKLSFPSWIVLGQVPDGFRKSDDHILEATEDLAITPSNTEVCIPLDALDFTKMPDGQGIIAPGHLYIDAHVEMTGSIYVLSDDCTGIGQFYPIVTTYLHMDQVQIEYVESDINIEEYAQMEASFSMEDIAEDIGNELYTLDFDDLRLSLDITNPLPCQMTFYADAQAFRKDTDGYDWHQHLEIADIPAASENKPSTSHYVYDIDGFPFSPLPDRVDFQVAPASSELCSIVVRPESTYDIGVAYSLTADSFGKDFSININQNINGLGLDITEVDLAEAKVKFNLINTLPFDFELSAQAIDAEGNILDYLNLEINGQIKGGTLESISTNSIEIWVTNKGQLKFDGVYLDLKSSVAGDKAVLNKNQYIQLTDISVSIPKGITYHNNDNK